VHAAAAYLNPPLIYTGKVRYEQADIRDGMNYVAEKLIPIKEGSEFAIQRLM